MQELPPEAAFRAAPFLPRYCGKFLQRKYFVAGPPVCGDFFAILQEMRRPGKGGATKHTMNTKTYPRTNDRRTIYLNTVIDNPCIEAGDYTIYNDFVNDPTEFEKNNVLYHYPINKDRLVIGKFCTIFFCDSNSFILKSGRCLCIRQFLNHSNCILIWFDFHIIIPFSYKNDVFIYIRVSYHF